MDTRFCGHLGFSDICHYPRIQEFAKMGRRNGVTSDFPFFLFFRFLPFFLFSVFPFQFFLLLLFWGVSKFFTFFSFFFRFLPFHFQKKKNGETPFARPLLRNPDRISSPVVPCHIVPKIGDTQKGLYLKRGLHNLKSDFLHIFAQSFCRPFPDLPFLGLGGPP